MRSLTLALLLELGVVLSVASSASPAIDDEDLASDEQALRATGLATDGASLMEFFRQRILSDSTLSQIAALRRELADDSFKVRERASASLIAMGSAAVPALNEAANDPDPEVAQRALTCLRAIPAAAAPDVRRAALRVLAARAPAGLVEVLLGYLPHAHDEDLEDQIVNTLSRFGFRNGRPDPVLATAASDLQPARRLAAAMTLARSSDVQVRATARRLLSDPVARVRFGAARALLQSGDRVAVHTLIDLVGEGPLTLAWNAEELLYRLARANAPPATIADGEPATRRAAREAWTNWWKAQKDTIDLTARSDPEQPLGLTVVCEVYGKGKAGVGHIWECGPEGERRWRVDGLEYPVAFQLLSGGRILVAEQAACRVTERNRLGKILWEKTLEQNPVSCQRLENGNTFIATASTLSEVARDGRTIYSFRKPGPIYDAHKLSNGHILYGRENFLVELDPAGHELVSLEITGMRTWAGVERLANGHFLVAECDINQVEELDADGEVFWSCTVDAPTRAHRLPNGRTLVTSIRTGSIVEVDHEGKECWRHKVSGRVFAAQRR
jgi:HEAT repeat protein